MSHYEDPIRLRVSFNRPAPTTVVLQGETRRAFLDWAESGDDGDEEYFMECLANQTEDYVAQWITIDEWDHDCK